MDPSHWCTGTPNAPYASPTPCVPPQPAREAFADGSQALQKASPALQVWEKEYKLEHFMALLWGKQTEDSQHWPDFVGLRQGIKS